MLFQKQLYLAAVVSARHLASQLARHLVLLETRFARIENNFM
jgi:hypothetical protein